MQGRKNNTNHVDLGFSVMSKIIKLGFQPDIVTFSTLINGLCTVGKAAQAMEFLYDFVARGYQPNVHTYTTIINGLCKIGETTVASGLLKKMEEGNCFRNSLSKGSSLIFRHTLQ